MDDTPDNGAVEQVLRASRPRPSDSFVTDLERRVLPPPPAHRAQGPRLFATRPVALAGAAMGLGLAGLALVFGLTGSGPLAPDGGEGAKAGDSCRTEIVSRRERVPRIVFGEGGRPEIRYRYETVERPVERCR